ncbi:hypothetical protein QWY75_10585 [Pontixanthobacter aestiaquae]|uniref:Uncharacterized protein n=1 Tax=Pontixanthobacter aestiaquae TaxID=1509367 RepID=A0A844Z0X1_9SPHN|nr:hypothetical protein [Pontixanthobacter aestiaquae]MDN3646645.1 hypothetical protein [Pontixanthobacter aestiaquae]MXO82371.1 hypothetical protein [Pontixanthobacter aestiaquae]
MSTILATPENLRRLKNVLMADFEMKSAHASEAIAALAGFRSHAAFRQSRSGSQHPAILDADFVHFEQKCFKLGYEADSSAYLRFSFNRIDWAHRLWCLIRKSDHAASDRWFYECQRRKIPFIVIKKARKHYSVSWDHISMESDYDNGIRNTYDNELHRIMFRTYQMICSGLEPKSFFDGTGLVGDVTGLSETSARQIADAFAKLLYPGNLRLEKSAA